MPSAIAQPEVIARAVLEKAPVAPPPPGSLQEAAVKIREKLNESGPRSALESMRQRKSIEQRKIDELIDTNCGTERNADGTKRRPAGSEVRGRFDEMQKWSKLSKDFLEKGYDGLDAAQKPIVKTLIEQALRAWPEADALFSGPPPMPVADKEAVIVTILKNPKYAEKVRSIFEGAIDPTKALKDTVSEAKTTLEEVRKKEEEKRNGIAKSNNEKVLVDTQLEQFRDGGGVGDGPKLQQMKAIEAELPTLKVNLIAKQDQLVEAQERVKDLERKRNVAWQRGADNTDVIDVEITTKRGEVRTLQREITEINDRVNLKTALEQEKTSLEQKKRQLEEERIKLDTELKNLTRERLESQANFSSAQLTRTSQEQDFVDSFKGVFSEATMQYLEENIAKAEEAQKKLIDEEKANTVDPEEQRILDAIETRWDKAEWQGGRLRRKINISQVRQDYPNLIAEGPRRILRDMLVSQITLLAGSPQYRAEVARIESKLNPAFVEKMQPKIVERLITRQVQTGKITEDDVRIIRESNWGQGVIQAAIKNKAELKNEIEQLIGQGALETSLWEKLKRMSNGSLLKFLLIIFGGVATLGILPAGMALKSVLKE